MKNPEKVRLKDFMLEFGQQKETSPDSHVEERIKKSKNAWGLAAGIQLQ